MPSLQQEDRGPPLRARGTLGSINPYSTTLDDVGHDAQAIGILMERYQMSEDRAFAFLVRASSHGNIELREIAQELVDERNGTNPAA